MITVGKFFFSLVHIFRVVRGQRASNGTTALLPAVILPSETLIREKCLQT